MSDLPPDKIKVAVVMTVKNEERILSANLQYHLAIGAQHLFVYFDATTDSGKASLSGLPNCSVFDSVASELYAEDVALEKFTSQAQEHHTARQCLNTYDAFLKCREMGIDWLISLDADELVATDLNEPSHLPSFFANLPPATEVVQLQTLEFLQDKRSYSNVFAEGEWFKATSSYPSRFERILKNFYNPFTKKQQRFNYWYGQHLGKAAIRVDRDLIPHNVHKFRLRNGHRPNTLKKGHILHYHAYDAQDFIKKFTNFSNHPDTFLSGNRVESIKLLLRDIVNSAGLSQDELEQYFADHLMFQASEIQKLKKNTYWGFIKRSQPAIVKVVSVTKTLVSKLEEE